jgi:hypothetical protein
MTRSGDCPSHQTQKVWRCLRLSVVWPTLARQQLLCLGSRVFRRFFVTMLAYDRRARLDNNDDDLSYTAGREHALSTSVPEEGSPLRNAVQPNFTRQRSSSTQLTRPKIPLFPSTTTATVLDDEALEGRDWDRSHSQSPPPRLSIETGYSSRSSASPNAAGQASSTSTTPDMEIGTRRSFKRAVTASNIPPRPRIPGVWNEADKTNSAPDSAHVTDYEVIWSMFSGTSVGISRAMLTSRHRVLYLVPPPVVLSPTPFEDHTQPPGG